MAGPGVSFSKPNSPTLKCPSTSENYGGSYRLKAGLITADELALTGESMYVTGNSYLNGSDMLYWSMTPLYYDDFMGSIMNIVARESLRNFNITGDGSVRPVINVKVDTGFTSGDGSKDNPYLIQIQ